MASDCEGNEALESQVIHPPDGSVFVTAPRSRFSRPKRAYLKLKCACCFYSSNTPILHQHVGDVADVSSDRVNDVFAIALMQGLEQRRVAMSLPKRLLPRQGQRLKWAHQAWRELPRDL